MKERIQFSKLMIALFGLAAMDRTEAKRAVNPGYLRDRLASAEIYERGGMIVWKDLCGMDAAEMERA